ARSELRVVRNEANFRLYLEGQRRQHLRGFFGEVRLLQEVADLLGDHAIKTIFGLVELRKDQRQRFFRQSELAHELAHVLRALGDLLVAGFDQPLDDLRQQALQASPLSVFLLRLTARRRKLAAAHASGVTWRTASVKRGQP